MAQVTLRVPETAFAALQKDPDEFAREMQLAAAVKWYEIGVVSQERAAEISGLSRSQFMQALSRFEVSPFQYTETELREELADAD